MKKQELLIQSHAKCILAGEHAVLRGSPAVVFPILTCGIRLSFLETGLPVQAEAAPPYDETLLLFFWGILEAALKQLNKPHSDLSGKFFIQNSIPMGAGLGFSAAFCAAISQWFLYKGWIEAPQLMTFARKLEDSFHGRSSGVDIAGALASQAIRFDGLGQTKVLSLTWRPKLYLSYSHQISVTAKCIERVDALWSADPSLAKKIDEEMYAAVLMAEQALCSDPSQGPGLLKKAMEEACSCFKRWGLVNRELEEHIQQLKTAGAAAVKPTGAGAGGYVLSFWEREPPDNLGFELLAVI